MWGFCLFSCSHLDLRLKRVPTGQKLTQEKKSTPPPASGLKGKPRAGKRPGKTALKEALIAAGGVISLVAESYRVSRQTVYAWIEFYDKHEDDEQKRLRSTIEASRQVIFDMAEDNIGAAVANGDIDVSKFVLTHMPVQKRARWSNRQEVTGADGSPFGMPAAMVEAMRKLGISADELMRQLEAMLLAEAGAA